VVSLLAVVLDYLCSISMNALEQYISEYALDETDVLNSLTEAGVISDNCVLACDVADSDCAKAIVWLGNNYQC